MKTDSYYSRLSSTQRRWLFGTLAVMVALVLTGVLMNPASEKETPDSLSIDLSIRQTAPRLGVTGKALARELALPLDVPKGKPLRALGVTPEELQRVAHHLRSHRATTLKYYIFAALVLAGLVYLTRLGRPDGADVKDRSHWYPRTPYVLSLLLSVSIAGFLLGKSPNPMEGVVKVFKSMAGLYPDPYAKLLAFAFFVLLAVVGNKLICGWACPFGALQELIYSLPLLRKAKQKKLPFAWTNAVRAGLFLAMPLFLFGIVGGRKGTVIYHQLNPFNLFDLRFETMMILSAVIISLVGAFFVYRPFCQLVCPFGFVSWVFERFSLYRVRVDEDKCAQCGMCAKACPLEAAQGRVAGHRFPADCFSCARCLNACPTDALQYRSIFKKTTTPDRDRES